MHQQALRSPAAVATIEYMREYWVDSYLVAPGGEEEDEDAVRVEPVANTLARPYLCCWGCGASFYRQASWRSRKRAHELLSCPRRVLLSYRAFLDEQLKMDSPDRELQEEEGYEGPRCLRFFDTLAPQELELNFWTVVIGARAAAQHWRMTLKELQQRWTAWGQVVVSLVCDEDSGRPQHLQAFGPYDIILDISRWTRRFGGFREDVPFFAEATPVLAEAVPSIAIPEGGAPLGDLPPPSRYPQGTQEFRLHPEVASTSVAEERPDPAPGTCSDDELGFGEVRPLAPPVRVSALQGDPEDMVVDQEGPPSADSQGRRRLSRASSLLGSPSQIREEEIDVFIDAVADTVGVPALRHLLSPPRSGSSSRPSPSAGTSSSPSSRGRKRRSLGRITPLREAGLDPQLDYEEEQQQGQQFGLENYVSEFAADLYRERDLDDPGDVQRRLASASHATKLRLRAAAEGFSLALAGEDVPDLPPSPPPDQRAPRLIPDLVEETEEEEEEDDEVFPMFGSGGFLSWGVSASDFLANLGSSSSSSGFAGTMRARKRPRLALSSSSSPPTRQIGGPVELGSSTSSSVSPVFPRALAAEGRVLMGEVSEGDALVPGADFFGSSSLGGREAVRDANADIAVESSGTGSRSAAGPPVRGASLSGPRRANADLGVSDADSETFRRLGERRGAVFDSMD